MTKLTKPISIQIIKRFYPGKFELYLPVIHKTIKNTLIPRSSSNIWNAFTKKHYRDYLLNKPQNSIIYLETIKLSSTVSGISGIYQAPPKFYEDSQTALNICTMVCKTNK